MKKILLVTFSLLMGIQADAQKKEDLTSSLHKYYGIKDALISDNAKEAAKQAEVFSTYLRSNPYTGSADLLTQLQKISSAKDITKQREFFALLSAQLIAMLDKQAIGELGYIQFCPMKKAEWISNDKNIKNPYYGKSMLTCGKTTDSIK
ncbi:MAG: DUF3347 domain-containing protein [Flavipsychrobacter sp.]